MTGLAQNQVNIQGIAQPEVKTVYVFQDLNFRNPITYCYEKYHSKGLDIVAISFDNKKDAWLRAISSMKMPWVHLSDLAGWQSIAATTYGIKSIPANILLDGEGKIIDIDLRGDLLDMRLKEIFKEK